MKTKAKTKTLGQLTKELQSLVNLYCRQRDCASGGANCISCGKWYAYEDLQGGHYISVTSRAIRFDERNINAQCQRCNKWLYGNPHFYRDGMINKYGEAIVKGLEAQKGITRIWERDELLEMIKTYKEKLNGNNG